MLVKINGILMSQAPAEGGEGGSAGGAGGASADAGVSDGGQESGSDGGEGESGSEDGESSSGGDGDGGGEFNNDFDFDKFLEFDPFANPTGIRSGDNKSGEEGGSPAAAEGGKEDPSQQQQKPAAGQEGKKDGGQDGGKPAAATNPELELLRQQNQQLMQALSQIQKPADAAAADKQGQAATTETPEQVRQARHERVTKNLPQYQFQIPQEVMAKMGSDDPNQIRAGLAEFATGVASVAHYNVAMQFEERIAELENQLVEKSVQQFRQTTQAEEAAKQTQKTVFDDFYGKYPELNKPGLQEFVQMQAQQLAQQYGVNGWSEQFRDTLGAHCKKLLGLGSGQGPSPDAGQGTKNGGQKPAGTRYNAGGGNGGGAGGGRQQGNLGDEIADTLLN